MTFLQNNGIIKTSKHFLLVFSFLTKPVYTQTKATLYIDQALTFN